MGASLVVPLFVALLCAPAQEAPASEPASVSTPDAATHAALERAALDYAEAYYEARDDYVTRSLHEQLVKHGVMPRPDGGNALAPMTYADFHAMVARLQEQGRPPAGPKQVRVLDALDRTALVELTGSWGVDYMQLARERADGPWKIRHVIWQAPAPERDAAARAAEVAGARAAAEAYLGALYDHAPERLDDAVHPRLAKHGFWRGDDGELRPLDMTRAELRDLAARWNADGWLPADAPRRVTVLAALDRTACVKVEAWWGIDYMNLAHVDGRWQILHVLWQSPPAAPEPDEPAAG